MERQRWRDRDREAEVERQRHFQLQHLRAQQGHNNDDNISLEKCNHQTFHIW